MSEPKEFSIDNQNKKEDEDYLEKNIPNIKEELRHEIPIKTEEKLEYQKIGITPSNCSINIISFDSQKGAEIQYQQVFYLRYNQLFGKKIEIQGPKILNGWEGIEINQYSIGVNTNKKTMKCSFRINGKNEIRQEIPDIEYPIIQSDEPEIFGEDDDQIVQTIKAKTPIGNLEKNFYSIILMSNF